MTINNTNEVINESLEVGGETLVLDVPTHFVGYQPRANRDRYHGVVAMREALGSSMNLPAVRETARLGTDRVLHLLHLRTG